MLVTERFLLNDDVVQQLYAAPVNWGFGALSEATYYRTYSRTMDEQYCLANPWATPDGRNETWADTVRRVINGVMSIRKDHYARNGINWDEGYWQFVAGRMAKAMHQFHLLPPGRGLWAMGAQTVYEIGSAALNNCFAAGTNIITADGITDLAALVDQEVSVLTTGGYWTTAKVRSFGVQPTQRVTLAPAGIRTNQRLTFDVTPDHRWVLADGSHTTNLSVGDRVPSMVNGPVLTSHPEYAAGQRHGIIFADGVRQSGKTHRVRLCGWKTHFASLFSDVVYPEHLGGDAVAYVRDGRDYKDLPSRDASADYVAGFILGWLSCDGQRSDDRIDSTDHAALDWLIDHAPYAGYVVVGDNTDKTAATNYGERRALVRRLTLREQCSWRVTSIEPLGMQEVFCPVVPGTAAFTLAGGVLTGNCGFVDVVDLATSAGWAMDMLMLGVGVGFSTDSWDEELTHPEVEDDWTFVVPDSREGWVESVEELIRSYTTPDLPTVRFDYSLVRPAGSPIKGFGGTASGPEPLRELHERVRRILTIAYYDSVPSSRVVADIMNAIGCCVVAGNVRRSAELATGSVYDQTFLNLKNYQINPERAEIGWMSNNSVLLERSEDFLQLPMIADRIRDNGEPGILNMMSTRKYGRYGDTGMCQDAAVGYNPCAEIPLESFELCNLAELFPSRIPDAATLMKATELATIYASTVSLLLTHRPETNAVVYRNRRIGISMSGIADWLDATHLSTVVRQMRDAYRVVRGTNVFMNDLADVSPAIRTTTVKPSGTVSLLAGVSPGMHWPVFRYGIRRVRVSMNSPVAERLAASGVPFEPDAYSSGTYVFEFPQESGVGMTRSVDEVSIWEQATALATWQREWADNAVSNTLTFNPKTEAKEIERVLAMFAPVIKSMSMLPNQDEQQSYAQPPYERTTREEFRRRSREIKPVDWSGFRGSDGQDSKFCETDACEVPVE